MKYKTVAELLLDDHLRELFGDCVIPEYKFHPIRKWRFDFAIPQYMLAVEIEGGIWLQGRHSRGHGFEHDCRKYGTATSIGWTVFRFTPTMILTGEAKEILGTWLGNSTGHGKDRVEPGHGPEIQLPKGRTPASGS